MRFVTRNLGWKLLSLGAAVLLWMAVSSEPELSTFITVPVEYRDLSSNLEINSDVVESVLLEVRGPSGELRGVPGSVPRYAVILDMSSVGPGQHTFTIDSSDVRLPRGIQLVRAVPAQIRLNFEPSESRSVPVQVRLADGLPTDFQVTDITAEPPVLAVVGPASRVGRVTLVQTDPIHLQPEAGTQQYHVDAFVNDPRVRFENSPEVTVQVTVEKK
jgi:YbbR domain-containing protein